VGLQWYAYCYNYFPLLVMTRGGQLRVGWDKEHGRKSKRRKRLRAPPVDHELWLRSCITRASVGPPSGHTGHKKDRIFSSNAEIFEENFGGLPKCRIGKMGHVSHPVDLNKKYSSPFMDISNLMQTSSDSGSKSCHSFSFHAPLCGM
jgi:hypothetical protein